MRWQPAILSVLLALAGADPALASDERTPGDSRPFSLHFGLGSQLNDGGDLESVAFGYDWGRAGVLVNVERNHVPERVRRSAGGGSVTRGGTMTSVSGEVRYTVPAGDRLAPFIMAGFGAGVSRPNVSGPFDDAVTNTVTTSYFGGGVRVRVRRSVEVFADARMLLVVERDTLGGRLPIRGGITWRF